MNKKLDIDTSRGIKMLNIESGVLIKLSAKYSSEMLSHMQDPTFISDSKENYGFLIFFTNADWRKIVKKCSPELAKKIDLFVNEAKRGKRTLIDVSAHPANTQVKPLHAAEILDVQDISIIYRDAAGDAHDELHSVIYRAGLIALGLDAVEAATAAEAFSANQFALIQR